jgi:protein-S-isoprenylcysteine O-methyltransferase Ste14
MLEEFPYRVALLIVMVFTMSVALYHRLKAASGERISHKEEGYAFAILLRLAGLVLWLSTFAFLIYPPAIRWATIPVPDWVRWMGIVIGVLCPALMYWTLSSLGKNLTDTVVVRSNATLTTHGPYRWVRHPFYVTAAIVMAAATLLSANWMIGLGSLLVLTLLTIRTPKEEEMLEERFGQQYRDYMQRTGRFFPKLRRVNGK